MTKEYIGSIDTRHSLTKYTLSNGVEIILNEQELEELYFKTDYYKEVLGLEAQVRDLEVYSDNKDSEINELEQQVQELEDKVLTLETKLESYKDTVRLYKEFQERFSKLKV